MMSTEQKNYIQLASAKGVPIKAWVKGVPLEDQARQQLFNVAELPFGVDIGCGMMAVQTDLNARDLPDNLHAMRSAIEEAVPHGRTNHGGKGDKGAWQIIPERNLEVWRTELKDRYDLILEKHPKLDRGNQANHLGTTIAGRQCADNRSVGPELDRW